ncbi:hypothetical protein QZH41_010330 [Actinostola sp. cb2023]|nr:hypothetical protein QZH41_010330 [Actinostola sp. cb2023]
MASFKETRIALLDSFIDGDIDEDEYVLLYDLNCSKNPEFPHENYESFDIDNMDPAECKAEFRFEKHHLDLLAESLGIPDVFICEQRSVCDGLEGLCMLLRRFTYPCRYSDLIPRFGKPVPVISMVTNTVMQWIYDNHHHRITGWNAALLDPVSLQQYADAVHRKGAALDNCFGFIDGTVRPICRPGQSQRIVYNGHKRVHALKFQSVTLPNGMIAQLYGPVEGKMHDAGMLMNSGLLNQLQQNAVSPAGHPLCLYGDPAYPLRVHLQAPFRNAILTPQMQQFNASMSAVRTSVEWLFGDIISYFKFLDYKKNLKIGLSSIGEMYVVCAILRNAMTCLYNNQTSDFFNIEPPTIQEYFA